MSRTEQAVFTNLCMVYDHAGNIPVEDRVMESDDLSEFQYYVENGEWKLRLL